MKHIIKIFSVLIISLLFVFCSAEPDAVDTTVADTTKPTLTITSPGTNSTGGPILTVSGLADDNIAISKVYVRKNTDSYRIANGTDIWSVLLTNTLGTNTINAYAVDTSGNKSSTATIIYIAQNIPSVNITYPASEWISVNTQILTITGYASTISGGITNIKLVLNNVTNTVTNINPPLLWVDWSNSVSLNPNATNSFFSIAYATNAHIATSSMQYIVVDTLAPYAICSNTITAAPIATIYGSVQDNLIGTTYFRIISFSLTNTTTTNDITANIIDKYWSANLNITGEGYYTNIYTIHDAVNNLTNFTNVIFVDAPPTVSNTFPASFEIVDDTNDIVIYFDEKITNGAITNIITIPEFGFTHSWNTASNILTIHPTNKLQARDYTIRVFDYFNTNSFACDAYKFTFYATLTGTSLLPNGSFEQGGIVNGRITNQYGETNWYPVAGTTRCILSNSGACDGNNSFWYTNVGNNSARRHIGDYIPVLPNTSYIYSLWIYAPSSNPTNVKAAMQIYYFATNTNSDPTVTSNEIGGNNYKWSDSIPTDIWTNFAYTNTSPAGANFLKLMYKGASITGTITNSWIGFDKIDITKE